jgi:mxaL protein
MAWAANSMIPQGLYSALRILQERYPGVRLVFFTDGQNAPPQTFKPNFTGHPGEVAGLIVGVGGGQPTLVPKYDRENHRIGYWENTEIAEMEIAGSAARNTNGPISPSNSGRTPESFAPLSGEHEPPSMTVPQPGYYQSWLDETHLLELSVITGLRYHRLESPDVLSQALHGSAFAESRIQLTDIRGFLALLALVLVLTGYWRRGPRIRRTSIYSRSAYRSAPEQRTTRP